MTTSYDYRKLLLEPAERQKGIFIPELSELPEGSEADVRNELKTLRRTNNRLYRHLSALESRNTELDAYAHTVAHNLKNPLAVILMTADAISDITDLNPRELKEFLEQIQATAHEMNDLIDNLLLLSEVRKADAPIGPVNMAEVAARIRRRSEYLIKAQRGRVHFPKTWPVAIGYAPWIEEVWANYLSNALKYGGEAPSIELGASVQPDGMVRFWLRDHGPGLAPEVMGRLFTPFSPYRQSARPGHGLGLSIVRRIVEKLGGEVGVESEPGKGCLFFFTLPAGVQSPEFQSGARKRSPSGPVCIGEEVH